MLQTEFEFNLPLGYVDEEGNLHKKVVMRLATAKDEIEPLKDPRVRNNEAYLVIILLSRVIINLGTFSQSDSKGQDVKIDPKYLITTKLIENLYAADLAYLQEIYNKVNLTGRAAVSAVCPKCEHRFDVELNASGES